MNRARQVIKNALADAKSPAVMFSGGKDSSLLLHLVREQYPAFCLWFHTDLQDGRFVRKMISGMDLDVWSYAPTDTYYIPGDEGVRLIHDYSFGPHKFPVIQDVRPGRQCGLRLSEQRSEFSPPFDVLFIGYKDSDEDETLGKGFMRPDGWTLGQSKVFAPLRHMTDSDVWQAIHEMNVPYDTERYEHGGSDPSELSLCTNCLCGQGQDVYCPDVNDLISTQPWDRQASLGAFRARFQEAA